MVQKHHHHNINSSSVYQCTDNFQALSLELNQPLTHFKLIKGLASKGRAREILWAESGPINSSPSTGLIESPDLL